LAVCDPYLSLVPARWLLVQKKIPEIRSFYVRVGPQPAMEKVKWYTA
jgi:hypothetical protein